MGLFDGKPNTPIGGAAPNSKPSSGSSLSGLFSSAPAPVAQAQSPAPQQASPTPPPKASIFSGLFGGSVKPNIQAPPIAAKPSPFWASTTQDGTSWGPSPELDNSGAPFLDFKKKGDESTTTDKTRIVPRVDPFLSTTTPADKLQTKRSISADTDKNMPTKQNFERDHIQPLELSGSNDQSNLQYEKGIQGKGSNTETDPIENDLAHKVQTGKMTLFEAQAEMAKTKGTAAPYTGTPAAPKPNALQGLFSKVSEIAGNVGHGIENATEKTGSFLKSLLPAKQGPAMNFPLADGVDVKAIKGRAGAEAQSKNRLLQLQGKALTDAQIADMNKNAGGEVDVKAPITVKAPFINAGVTVPDNAVTQAVGKGIVEWPERAVKTIGQAAQIMKTGGAYDPKKSDTGEFNVETAFDAQKQMHDALTSSGASETQAGWISSIFAGSSAVLDVAPLGEVLNSGLKALISARPVSSEAHIAASELLGHPQTIAEAETAYKNIQKIAHPDITGGSDTLSKEANKAIEIIRNEGVIERASPLMQKSQQIIQGLTKPMKGYEALDNVNPFSKDFLNKTGKYNINETAGSTASIVPRKALPGLVDENPNSIPVGLSTKNVRRVGGEYKAGSELIEPKYTDDIAFHDQFKKDITTLPKEEARDVAVKNIDEIVKDNSPAGTEQFKMIVDKFGTTEAKAIMREGIATDTMRPKQYNELFDKKMEAISTPEPTTAPAENGGVQIKNNEVFEGKNKIGDLILKKDVPGEAHISWIKTQDNLTVDKTNPSSTVRNYNGTKIIKSIFDDPSINKITGDSTLESQKFWEKMGATFKDVPRSDGDTGRLFTLDRDSFQKAATRLTAPEVKKPIDFAESGLWEQMKNDNMEMPVAQDFEAISNPENRSNKELSEAWMNRLTYKGNKPEISPDGNLVMYRGTSDGSTLKPLTYLSASQDVASQYGKVSKFEVDPRDISYSQTEDNWIYNPRDDGSIEPIKTFNKRPIFTKLDGPQISVSEAKALINEVLENNPVRVAFSQKLIDGSIGTYTDWGGINARLTPLIKLYAEGEITSATTALHEAGHYMFKNLLTNSERELAYDTAKSEITLFDRAKYKMSGYKSSEYLEEYIVDQYAAREARGRGYKTNTVWDKVFEIIDSVLKKIADAYNEIKAKLAEHWDKINGPEGQRGFIKNPFVDEGTGAEKGYSELKAAYEKSGPSDVEGFSKADEYLSNIFTELQLAKPGSRLFTGYGADQEVTGISSTFPDWIPENLRSSDMIKKILPNLEEGIAGIKYPDANKPAQRKFVDMILDIVDEQSGVDTKAIRNNILNSNEKTNTRTKAEAPAGSNSSSKGSEGSDKIAIDNPETRPVPNNVEPIDLVSQEDLMKFHPAQPFMKYVNGRTLKLPEILEGYEGVYGRDMKDLLKKKGLKNVEAAQKLVDNYFKEEQYLLKLQRKIYGINDKGQLIGAKGEEESLVRSVGDVLQEMKATNGEGYTDTQKQTLEEQLAQQHSTSKVGSSFEEILDRSDIPVKQKVGIMDYLRTPDHVLKEVGLGDEARLIRKKYQDYTEELPQNIQRITDWSKKATRPGASKRIFQYLDHLPGGEVVHLDATETRIAGQIQEWLKEWAKRLDLPHDQQISHYITHIFEKDFIQKEFDPDIAKILTDKVAGSVYDPFLEQRLGAQGYVQDAWRALDAYVKRGTRKVHMDVALERLKIAAQNLPGEVFDYVKNYADRINMRPTKIDNLIDVTIKKFFGYRFGQRPVLAITSLGRRLIYRGTLGLNIGSALKNLTQGANTYAKLGEKYTLIGYYSIFTKGTAELEKVGVLGNDFIEDRKLSSTKKFWEKVDKGLYFLFEQAEKINRGSAYYGAKSKGLAEGMDEEKAIEYAKNIVRDTQFTFGSVDTPVGMQSDIVKFFTQFKSYSVKQAEFLAGMGKRKQWAGLIRYTGAMLFLIYTLGKFLGMKPSDVFPKFSFDMPQTLKPIGAIFNAVTNVPDQFGKVPTFKQKVKNIADTLVPFVPAGAQAKKSLEGVQAITQGASVGLNGNIQYPVTSLKDKITAVLFGKSNSQSAQTYFQKDEISAKEKERVQPIYDKVQKLKAENTDGADAEIQAIVDNLSDPDYKIYQNIKRADATKLTLKYETKMLPVVKKVQELKAAGKIDEVQAIVDNMTDEEYKAYGLVKKKLGFEDDPTQ